MDGSLDGVTDAGGSEALPGVVAEAAGEAGLTNEGEGAGDEPIAAMS